MPTRREIIARIETPLTALYGEREARQIARIVVMELGGRLYFEIHENFADETFRMLTREGFPDTAVRRDLNDKNRMTCSLQRR